MSIFLEVQVELRVVSWVKSDRGPESMEPIEFIYLGINTCPFTKLQEICFVLAIIIIKSRLIKNPFLFRQISCKEKICFFKQFP